MWLAGGNAARYNPKYMNPRTDKSGARPKTRFVRLSVVLVIVAVLIIAALKFTLSLLTSPYVSFTKNTDHYFSEVAYGCNLILKQHSHETNKTIVANVGNGGSIVPISIPGDDASLPKIIRRLHPDRITVLPEEVVVYVDYGSPPSNGTFVPRRTPGYGIKWAPRYGVTNLWELTAFADEGENTVVYSGAN